MLSKTSLIALSLSLSTCSTLPEKPEIEVCSPDTPRQECICKWTEAPEVKRHPIEYLDKGTCFRPPEWEKLQNYIDLLEEYAKNKGQTGLLKELMDQYPEAKVEDFMIPLGNSNSRIMEEFK